MVRFYTLLVILLTLSSAIHTAYAQNEADWMPDANLRNSVRTALSLNADEPLTQQKMLNLNGLNANRLGICDLTGLEYATNLRSLSVGGNQVSNLTPLENLASLGHLYIGDNLISDISPLAYRKRRICHIPTINCVA
jgi:Leucine-rich repeat (LRR) protein